MKTAFYSLMVFFLNFTSFSLFAQEEEVPPSSPDQGLWQTFMMVIIALAFFYILLWRPEQKRRKAMEAQRSALKKGDRVVAMGMIGTVVRTGDQTVILKMYDGAKIEFFKSAITEIMPETEESKKEEIKEEKE